MFYFLLEGPSDFTRRRRFFLAYFLMFHPFTQSFSFEISRTKRRQYNFNGLYSTSSHETEDSLPSGISKPPLDTELWLDLRSTVMHPKVAMDYLEEQLGTSSFVNRILLSDQVFQNLVDYSDLYLTASQILYHDFNNDDIFLSTSRGLSFPFGRFQPLPSFTDGNNNNAAAHVIVHDPVQAIEIISGGKWLVLGNDENNIEDDQETMRIKSIGNFLDIVSSAAGAPSWTDTNGLVLPNGMTSAGNDKGVGGVAVKCFTESAVMKLASTLQLMNSGGMTTITESGIILHNNSGASSVLPTAVILPFDIDLWQFALLIFGASIIM